MTNRERDAILAFWDVLVPGAPGWPQASAAIASFAVAFDLLAEADRTWLAARAPTIADRAAREREQAMTALERDQPEPFARVLGALYGAYYTSAAVHEAVGRLAEAGPREAAASFDATLLRHVMATQAGARRM